MSSPNDLVDLQEVYAGALAFHQQGRAAEALPLYRQVLALLPDADLVHYNHGLACYECGDFSGAADAFRQAVNLQASDPDYWYNLALACQRCSEYGAAVAAYEKALALRPGDADLLYNLACCLQDAGELSLAMQAYGEVLAIDPQDSSALGNLAYLHHLRGEYAQAHHYYRELLRHRPDHQAARHMLAALDTSDPDSSGGAGDDGPPPDYVRELFDRYSASFEQSLLEKLEYRVPALLRQLVDQQAVLPQAVSCLDLGCGTGLAGVAFRPLCRRLAGVDLSPGMVELAREKAIYDELTVAELVLFLREYQARGERVELMVAADVLAYFADLQPLFSAAAGCAGAGALFCFSTEHGTRAGWHLQPSGRYAHDPFFVLGVAQKAGWGLVSRESACLRKEGDGWIMGDVYLMRLALQDR